jgi:hypothetical protein
MTLSFDTDSIAIPITRTFFPLYFSARALRFGISSIQGSHVIWTLTSNGKTEKAYGTLKPDYVVNATVMAANFGAGGQTGTVPDLVGNVGPVLKVEGERTRRVKVGEAVSLVAVATDDGKPRARPMPALIGGNRTVPNSATGLRLVWLKYRGAGEVAFDPPQFTA